MEPQRLPFSKAFDRPFISLDETSIELASILFLFLAVFAVVQVRWRRQLVRRFVQVGSLLVFFYFIYSCLGVFGMIRNSLYGVTLIGTVYSESFYWMALPVVVLSVTLLMGTIFCGWICPTGTIQDFVVLLRRFIIRRPFRGTAAQLILLGFSLAGFVLLTIWISLEKHMFIEDSSLHWAAALLLVCYLVVLGVIDDIPSRKLRVVSVLAIFLTAVSHVAITSPVHFAFTSRSDPASALSTLVIGGGSLVIARAWCRYACPWGYLMGWLHRFSRLKIQRNPAACNSCGQCVDVCDVAAVEPTGVRHEHCQFCYACVDRCPGKALEVVDVWQGGAQQSLSGPLVSLGSSRSRGDGGKCSG